MKSFKRMDVNIQDGILMRVIVKKVIVIDQYLIPPLLSKSPFLVGGIGDYGLVMTLCC